MKISTSITVIAAFLLAAAGVNADTCTSIRQRREFRTLSPAERQAFINALKTLQNSTNRSKYDAYVARHVAVDTYAHGNSRFLSWHRAYLRAIEKDLQAIDPTVMIPYWDWAYDSQAPEKSIIFSKDYFGGNGNSRNRWCVTDGQFADWKPRNTQGCLVRAFNGGSGSHIPALWGWEPIRSAVFTATNYNQFRINLEGPHGNVHNGINGQFSTMRSPDDPLFWLHHGFVDKLWADWQNLRSSNFRSYGGKNGDGSNAKSTDNLDYGYTVNDVFDTRTPYINGTIPDGGTYVTVDVPGVNSTNVTDSEYETSYDDRSNIINIRHPQPLPEEWCKMNHISVDEVRSIEEKAKKVIDQFNHLPGYISSCALVNRADVLSKLAQEGVKFHGYIGNKKIDINYDAANPAAVQNVQSKVVAVVNQVYKQVNFVYPKVVQNIINAVDVFNGGKTALPAYGNGDNGNNTYGDDDCDDEDDKSVEDDDCDENDNSAEAPAPAVVPVPCEEEGDVAPAPAVVPCEE
ncbi:hypothetical protein BDF22DRAFT_763107 [Syncephalis plumigaleata]|nr:hypothetical protein BDF22DRAFT_763107 [Syncephalis plumigaleata]